MSGYKPATPFTAPPPYAQPHAAPPAYTPGYPQPQYHQQQQQQQQQMHSTTTVRIGAQPQSMVVTRSYVVRPIFSQRFIWFLIASKIFLLVAIFSFVATAVLFPFNVILLLVFLSLSGICLTLGIVFYQQHDRARRAALAQQQPLLRV